MIDIAIPKFLKRGKDGSLPEIKKAKGKASKTDAPKSQPKEPDPYMAVLDRQDPVVGAAIEAEMKAHRFPRHWLLEGDTVRLFAQGLREKAERREEGLQRLRALKGSEPPKAARPAFGAGVYIVSVSANPRKAGTRANIAYSEMERYVKANPAADVAKVLAETSYRRDDFSWDLERKSISTDVKAGGKR